MTRKIGASLCCNEFVHPFNYYGGGVVCILFSLHCLVMNTKVDFHVHSLKKNYQFAISMIIIRLDQNYPF